MRGKKGGSPSGALGPTHLRIAGRRRYLKMLAQVALAGAQKQQTHLEACADVEARGGRPRLQWHLPVRRKWAHWEPRWPPLWSGVSHHLRGSPLLACAMAEESCLSPACFHRPQRFLSDWMFNLAESLWEIKSFHVVPELKRARGLGGLAGLLGQGRSRAQLLLVPSSDSARRVDGMCQREGDTRLLPFFSPAEGCAWGPWDGNCVARVSPELTRVYPSLVIPQEISWGKALVCSFLSF